MLAVNPELQEQENQQVVMSTLQLLEPEILLPGREISNYFVRKGDFFSRKIAF
jgi:hypothetical protein